MPARNALPRKTNLIPTDIPGVFRNKVGTLVDELNVALSFKALQAKDDSRFAEALRGGAVTQPADLLKAVALDPRMPLHTRLDAANKAAPYFTPKKLALQGVEGAPPIGIQDLSSLPQKELDRLEVLYAQAAEITGVRT